MLKLRQEQVGDEEAIRNVHQRAFGRTDEADLVDRLRDRGIETVSLVADVHKEIVGHILFTPVSVEENDAIHAMGLGPLAVLPEHQRRGIGEELVRFGLEICERAGTSLVFVVGHPEYYPRFGFDPAKTWGFSWDRPVPDDVFMVIGLPLGSLRKGRGGIVHYHAEFDRV